MEDWQVFFKIVYHPDPGHYYIHWLSTHQPVPDFTFKNHTNAGRWLAQNWKSIVDKEFENEVLK